MKFLLVADLHYALPQFDWVVREAVHYDAVVLAGDMLDIAAIASADAQIAVVRAYLERLAAQVPVVVCSGNHDLDRATDGENVAAWLGGLSLPQICADGDAVVLDDILISALPWWDGPNTLARIGAQLERDSARRASEGIGRWIWAHHAPPADSPVAWGGTRHYGDAHLREWIDVYRPDLVCSGHVHHAPFVADGAWADLIGKTWCFNMGQQIGDVPAHIAVETELGAALWFSLEGGQELDLRKQGSTPERLTAAPGWF